MKNQPITLDDEYCKAKGCQATLLVCESNEHGETHHLSPSGPAAGRVMRCIWCSKTQAEIEAAAEAAKTP